MTDYTITYKLPIVGTLGVEDYKAPGDHFFPETFKNGERKQFNAWASGCGIGNFTTADDAEACLESYAKQKLQRLRKELLQRLLLAEEELSRIEAGNFKFYLKGRSKETFHHHC